jgi:hypothetical protein
MHTGRTVKFVQGAYKYVIKTYWENRRLIRMRVMFTPASQVQWMQNLFTKHISHVEVPQFVSLCQECLQGYLFNMLSRGCYKKVKPCCLYLVSEYAVSTKKKYFEKKIN